MGKSNIFSESFHKTSVNHLSFLFSIKIILVTPPFFARQKCTINFSYRGILVLILLLISNIVLLPQQNFEEVYTSLSENGMGAVIRQDEDGYTVCGYTLSGTNTVTGYFVQKIDLSGRQLAVKEYAEKALDFNESMRSIIQSNDSGFLIAAGDSLSSTLNRQTYGVKIIKLDDSGNILFEKSIDGNIAYYELSLFISHDSSIYITIRIEDYNSKVIKTDPQGNIIWQHEYDFTPAAPVQEFSDGKLLLPGKTNLLWLDEEGNILAEKTTVSDITRAAVILSNDDIITATSHRKLLRLNRNGDLLWSHNTNTLLHKIIETSSGKFLSISGSDANYLQNYDADGNLLWEKFINTNNYAFLHFLDMHETGDKGFIVTGSDEYITANPINAGSYPLVVKTDSLANFGPELCLVFPYKKVNALSQYEITWLSEGINEINISFSTNSGASWVKIADNIAAVDGRYSWTVPLNISQNCILKLAGAENPEVFDLSNSEFTIMPILMKNEYIAANEVKMWIGQDGESSHSPITDGQGFFWPGGENAVKGGIFQDGLIWGGKVDGQIRVGGNTYRSGIVPGNILSDGSRADSKDYLYQVWKLKRNWQSIQDEMQRSKYQYNHNHWPVSIGVPWIDANQDGEYTAGIDHPVYYGDETLFFTANDLDTVAARFLYGSDPMGLEIQCLTFAKDTTTGLKDAVFKKYKLINKSTNNISEMYFGYWTDDDMGDANDDFVGVDTSLNLGYTWNGSEDDYIYGNPPPSLGHLIIQGPIVPAPAFDSARFGDGWRKGYRNLGLTGFAFFIGGSAYYSDADLGMYSGSLQMYNNLQGLTGDGSLPIDPVTGEPVEFMLAGDPVSGTGWYEGDGWPGGPLPGDRRFLISSGPFNLAPGDTQEIVIAIFMGLGNDRFKSITALRDKVPVLRNYYNNELIKELKYNIPTPPVNYFLSQNYPNPFNAATNIDYILPQKSVVTIKIYDILGREVKTINQGEQVPWRYTVNFNAASLASGVYFYRIEAVPVNASAGNFVETKKMILLK